MVSSYFVHVTYNNFIFVRPQPNAKIAKLHTFLILHILEVAKIFIRKIQQMKNREIKNRRKCVRTRCMVYFVLPELVSK